MSLRSSGSQELAKPEVGGRRRTKQRLARCLNQWACWNMESMGDLGAKGVRL